MSASSAPTIVPLTSASSASGPNWSLLPGSAVKAFRRISKAASPLTVSSTRFETSMYNIDVVGAVLPRRLPECVATLTTLHPVTLCSVWSSVIVDFLSRSKSHRMNPVQWPPTGSSSTQQGQMTVQSQASRNWPASV